MHRLQELARLHGLGEGAREVARQLQMSPNTEREYRQAFAAAGLLEGDPESVPDLARLREVVEANSLLERFRGTSPPSSRGSSESSRSS